MEVEVVVVVHTVLEQELVVIELPLLYQFQ